MSTRRRAVLTVVIVCLGVVALAQEQIPLQNWPAPPYWTPPAQPTLGATADGREAAPGPSDVSGLPTGPLAFVAIMPCRLVDTRFANPQQPAPLATTATPLPPLYPPSDQPNWPGPYDPLSPSNYKARLVGQFDGTGNCGIPAAAAAVSLNMTIVYPGSNGDVRIWPYSGTVPMVSSINVQTTTQVATNAVIVSLPTYNASSPDLSVRFTVYPKGTGAHLILDVNGYYAPQAVVNTLNTLFGNVTLAQGPNVMITPSGNSLTISSGGAGGTLPSGSVNQTLRHDGLSWVVSSALTNDGTKIRIDGNLDIIPTSDTTGLIWMGGRRFLHRTGAFNVFVGEESGNLTLTGTSSSALGYAALSSLTSGFNNTAVGNLALHQTTGGRDSTGVGATALAVNTTGSFNTAVGSTSLEKNTTANNNTAVGAGALFAQSYANAGTAWDADNTAVGLGALMNNYPLSTSNGIRNTAVGAWSLIANTTGHHNTAVGFDAGASVDTIVGYDGSTSVTFQPTLVGSYNTFLGHRTGAVVADPVNNCTVVGSDAYCDASNQVRLGNRWVTSIGGKVAWSALSDLRAKRDVEDLPLGLDLVMRLRPVQYRLLGGNDKIDMGFVAQDIEALLGDEYNVLAIGGDPQRTLSLRHSDLIAPLVKAVQEQQVTIQTQHAALAAKDARIVELERKQAAQQAQMDELLARMTRFEAAGGRAVERQ